NKLVRRFSSADKGEEIKEKELRIPTYWIRPSQILPAKAGMQRFVWDLHYPPPEGVTRDYPISAIYYDTPSAPLGPTVLPGVYTVKLTVGGKNFTQPLVVKMDPRVKTPAEGLASMFNISMRSYEGMKQVNVALIEARNLRSQLKSLLERAGQGAPADAIKSLDQKAAAIEAEKEQNLTKVQKDLN